MFGISAILGLAREGLAFFNKQADVGLEKYKVDGTVNIAAMQADAEIAKARAGLATAGMAHAGERWARYLFIYPVGIWFALAMYDSAFRNILPDILTWRVLAPPDSFANYIWGVFAYLFVLAWKR